MENRQGWYDLDGNGTHETQGPLTLQYDSVKSFLYERELNPAVTPHPRRALRYLHDGLGRLTRIDKDVGGTITTLVSFGYDTSNRLAWRKEGSNARVWLIYDGSQVIAEQTETTRLKSYIWAGAQLIQSRDQGGLELHHHQDRLGSVVLSTKKTGSTTELHGRAQFDPYGKKIKQVGWEANGLGTVYGYAGSRWDETARMNLMGHRWYDPEMGRFIEQDPIGESGGYNLYAYANASPVMWVDPKGLKGAPLDGSPPSTSELWPGCGASCQLKGFGRTKIGGMAADGSRKLAQAHNDKVRESNTQIARNAGINQDQAAQLARAALESRDGLTIIGRSLEESMRGESGAGDSSPGSSGGVVVTGPAATDGVQDLAAEVGLSLSIDSSTRLQAASFVGPKAPRQQLVADAIGSSKQITLNFVADDYGNWFFGRTDGAGTHTIDVSDTAWLKTARNQSPFTAGAVVLHELAEGLAEVRGDPNPHEFALRFAPGLRTEGINYVPDTGPPFRGGEVGLIVVGAGGESLGRLDLDFEFQPLLHRIPSGGAIPNTGPISALWSTP